MSAVWQAENCLMGGYFSLILTEYTMQTTRHKYLIAYDISDHKRLYQAHKKVEAFVLLVDKNLFMNAG